MIWQLKFEVFFVFLSSVCSADSESDRRSDVERKLSTEPENQRRIQQPVSFDTTPTITNTTTTTSTGFSILRRAQMASFDMGSATLSTSATTTTTTTTTNSVIMRRPQPVSFDAGSSSSTLSTTTTIATAAAANTTSTNTATGTTTAAATTTTNTTATTTTTDTAVAESLAGLFEDFDWDPADESLQSLSEEDLKKRHSVMIEKVFTLNLLDFLAIN